MKKILLFICLIVSISSFAQSGNDTTKYVWYKKTYGDRFNRGKFDSVLMIPRDTIYSKYGIALLSGVFYTGNGTQWNLVTGGGGTSGPAGGDLTSTYPNPLVANGAITNAKLANEAANTLKGNNTGSPAPPADLTVAQVKTLLGYTPADIGATPTSRTLTINGTTFDLSANRTWTISTGGLQNVYAQNGLTPIDDSTLEFGGNLIHDTHLSGSSLYKLYFDSLDLFYPGHAPLAVDSTSYAIAAINKSTGKVITMSWPTFGGGGGSSTFFGLTDQDSTGMRNGYSPRYNWATSKLTFAQSNTKEGYLGTIYSKGTWANTNDFAVHGTATISNSSGHQTIGGGAGTFTATIDVKPNATDWITRLQYWKIVAKMVVTTQGNGVGFGIVSSNTWASNNWNIVGRVDLRAIGNQQMIINGGSGFTAINTGSSLGASVAVNDTIYITVERAVNVITFTYKNKTTGVGGQLTYTYDLTNAASFFGANTGKFSIFEFGGAQELDSLAITSTEIKNAQIAVICDSKGEQWAGSVSRNFANQLGNSVPVTINLSHGSDRLVEYLTAFQELKALSPKQVIIADPGRNDSASGRTHAQILTDLRKLWDSCTVYGMNPILTTPIYETSLDMSWLTTYILANYPAANVIDLWTPIKSNTAAYLDADNVHPTPAGHDTIYNTILKSYKYQGGINLGAGFVPNTTVQSSGNFNLSGTGTLGTKLTVGNSAIGTGVIIADFQTATDKHVKIFESSSGQMRWGAYTDAGTSGTDMAEDFNTLHWNFWSGSTATEAGEINSSQNWFIGANAATGGAQTGARLDVTGTAFGVATFASNNSNGAYIAIAGAAIANAPDIYLGTKAVTNGASAGDLGLRSQNSVIYLTGNGGTPMAQLKSGKFILNGLSANNLVDSANGRLQIRTDALGTTQTATSGIALFNTTAAANNAQQISPFIKLNGKVWSTGAVASKDISMQLYLVPDQGTTGFGHITFEGATAGAAYTQNLLNIYSTGEVAQGDVKQAIGQHEVTSTILPNFAGLYDHTHYFTLQATSGGDFQVSSTNNSVTLPYTVSVGHIYGSGGTPTTTSLGTNVTSATVTGNDNDFKIVVVTSGAVSGNICTINYNNTVAWTANPRIVFSANDQATANACSAMFCGATSTSVASFGGVISGAGTYTFSFHTMQ